MGDTDSEHQHSGDATRRQVLGDVHVDRAHASATDFDKPLQALFTDAAWGQVWSRQDISKRERSMITIALLAAFGRDEELALHVRATANTGASADDVREVLLHVAIYAGIPAANHAVKIAKAALTDIANEAGENP